MTGSRGSSCAAPLRGVSSQSSSSNDGMPALRRTRVGGASSRVLRTRLREARSGWYNSGPVVESASFAQAIRQGCTPGLASWATVAGPLTPRASSGIHSGARVRTSVVRIPWIMAQMLGRPCWAEIGSGGSADPISPIFGA
eukprot:1145337-Rhodomonas_salina.1